MHSQFFMRVVWHLRRVINTAWRPLDVRLGIVALTDLMYC